MCPDVVRESDFWMKMSKNTIQSENTVKLREFLNRKGHLNLLSNDKSCEAKKRKFLRLINSLTSFH